MTLKAFVAIGTGLFLLVALLNLAAAQSESKPAPATAAAVADIEGSKTPQITKVPVHVQFPASLAKAIRARPSQKITAPPGSLVTITSENFEGTFPSGLWTLNSGDYTWAKRNCAAQAGSFSAWAVGGGAIGSTLACGTVYPHSVSTIMAYGPFDLSDANWAAFSFFISLNSEGSFDFFDFLASDDGINFSGYALSGSTGGQWIPFALALTAVPTGSGAFENFTGKDSVWIAFAFSSDNSVNLPNGAFVDDVVLQKGMVNVPTIVSSFSSPGPSPRGLAFDGSNLWCSDATNDRIYRLTTTGSVVSSFASPGSIPTGLAWDGTNLWNADANTDRIYRLSTTGTVLSSFSTPGSIAYGLAWDGIGLWNSDGGVPTIWKLNTTGGIISSFSAPGTFHFDLAWDGQSLWLADAEALLFYRMDTAGNVLDYYLAPATFPTGLEWDGTNLWAADLNTDLIYNLSVAPPATCTFCGDVNVDGLVNSTDALIILAFDVGQQIPPAFLDAINRGCGDVNLDGATNSTDALIILTCDAGLPQCPPNVGKPGGCQ